MSVHGRKKKPRFKRTKEPYAPCTRDLEIYAYVCTGKSYNQAGKKWKLTGSACYYIVNKIDAWLAPQLMSKIREIKSHHTTCLMHIFREAMHAWAKSKRMEEIENEKNATQWPGTDVKRRYPVGNPAYLAEARAALDEIRDIWGANAPLQIEQTNEIRVAGQQLADVQSKLMQRLTEAGVN